MMCTFQVYKLNLHSHDLRVPVGSLACIYDICVLAMEIISIDRTQRSIPVQTPNRKFRGSLCSLPRKLTKVTPSGVKVNLAEKIIFFILLISAQLIHFYCVAVMHIILHQYSVCLLGI